MKLLLGIILSYLCGSIPTAYIFGKLYKGIDIRQHGSGNVGTTNAFRVLGKIPGIIVLIVDIFKGIVPIVFIANYFSLQSLFHRILLGVVVVAGHNWTIFLNFKGGKGIATSLGVLIGLTIAYPSLIPALGGCVSIWLVVFFMTRYVSLSSITASIVLPVIMIFTKQSLELISLGIIFCIFVNIRHWTNLKRLLKGTEPKVNFFVKKDR